jgi:hypothetical protein
VVICGFNFYARFVSFRLVGLLLNITKVHADINANSPLTHTHYLQVNNTKRCSPHSSPECGSQVPNSP